MICHVILKNGLGFDKVWKVQNKAKKILLFQRSLMIKSTSFLCIKNHVFKNSHYNNLWDIHWKLARNLKTKPKFFSHRKNSHKVLRFKIRCKLLPVQESRYCFFNTFKMWIQKMLYHKNTEPMPYFLSFTSNCLQTLKHHNKSLKVNIRRFILCNVHSSS